MNKIYTCLLAVAAAAIPAGKMQAQTTGSYVPAYQQEQSNWCWAGCSAMLYWAYGSGTKSQCTLVGVSRDKENGSWFSSCDNLSSSSASPCSSPGTFNSPQSIYGCDGSIESILDNYSIPSTGYGYAFSAAQLTTATSAKKHMVARWGWNSGGGHFVVINRYKSGNVYFNNPASGSAYIWSYANFKTSNGNATWTHTLRMDNSAAYGSVYTNGDIKGINLSANGITEANLNFYPNPVSNRLNCIIDQPGDKEAQLSIYNAVGQLQYETTQPAGQSTFSIDVSTWSRGIYYLQLNGIRQSKRLTVQ